MALNALVMKGIGLFGKLGVFHVGGIMTLQAAFGNLPFFGIGRMTLAAGDQGLFISGGVMMAVGAIQGIPIGGSVGLVVEKDFAGIGMVHQADGSLRRFDRKGGIAYDGNQ
jgi:hypothetical protein